MADNPNNNNQPLLQGYPQNYYPAYYPPQQAQYQPVYDPNSNNLSNQPIARHTYSSEFPPYNPQDYENNPPNQQDNIFNNNNNYNQINNDNNGADNNNDINPQPPQQDSEHGSLISYDINDPSLEMSPLFLERDVGNKILMLGAVIVDATLAIVSMVLYNQGCSPENSQGIMTWNAQWMVYLFAKAAYHFVVSLQLFSYQKKRELCDKLGQLKTAQENAAYMDYFNNVMTLKRKAQVRAILDKQYMSFYYQRNKILKFIYYAKVLATLCYVIYGFVEFFSGPNFSLVFENYQEYENSCQTGIAWFAYISLLLVIIGNRGMFDILIFVVIAIPLIILVLIPYTIYKRCKKRRFAAKAMEAFQTVKYTNGAVEGETDCSICQMAYVIDEEVTILPCNKLHHFHKSCISAWFQINSTCPLCRQDFSNQLQLQHENVQQQQ